MAEVRATDKTGYTQTADRAAPSPTARADGIPYSSPSSPIRSREPTPKPKMIKTAETA